MKSGHENREFTLLLEILGNKQAKLHDTTPDGARLVRYAAIHRVNFQLLQYARENRGLLTVEQFHSLDALCRKNAMKSLDQLRELLHLSDLLTSRQIPFVTIKGPQLARMIYGREAYKESLDLDILLKYATDLQKVHDLFRQEGYSRSNLNLYKRHFTRKIFLVAKREINYFNPANKMHIDLHIRAGANTYLTAQYFSHVFDHVETDPVEGHPVPVFSPDQYLVYLCYHGALHQYFRLGWLMDIRTFLKVKKEALSCENIMAIAREMHCMNSLYLAFAMLHEYFGDPIPLLIQKNMPVSAGFSRLVLSCRQAAQWEPGYDASLKGRWNKFYFKMLLIQDWAGRIDLIYGICMRNLANLLK